MYVFKDYLIKFMDRKIILSHTSPKFLDRAISLSIQFALEHRFSLGKIQINKNHILLIIL